MALLTNTQMGTYDSGGLGTQKERNAAISNAEKQFVIHNLSIQDLHGSLLSHVIENEKRH